MIVFVAIFALTISVGIYAYTKHNESNSKVGDASVMGGMGGMRGMGGMCGDSDDKADSDYQQMADGIEDNSVLDTMNEHATNFMNSITAGISTNSSRNISVADESRVRLLVDEDGVGAGSSASVGSSSVSVGNAYDNYEV